MYVCMNDALLCTLYIHVYVQYISTALLPFSVCVCVCSYCVTIQSDLVCVCVGSQFCSKNNDRIFDSVVGNLAKNFAEGTEYFKVYTYIVILYIHVYTVTCQLITEE